MVYNQVNRNHPKAENVSESVKSKMNRLSIKTFFASLKFSADCCQSSCMLLFRWNGQFNGGSTFIHSYSFNLVLDIDECSSNSHSCDVNAVCNNTRGFYTCACKPGYSGDGKNCTGELNLPITSTIKYIDWQKKKGKGCYINIRLLILLPRCTSSFLVSNFCNFQVEFFFRDLQTKFSSWYPIGLII